MRHSKMGMTLYYSHTHRANVQSGKRCFSIWFLRRCGYKCGGGNNPVMGPWFGNLCIMMNLPQVSGRLTQR